jgi:glutaconate CoA-transferase, subunit A
LIRRGVRDLHLIAVPTSGLQADLLIGAGCVRLAEAAGISLGEYGTAPCFTRAVTSGAVAIRDSSCPAIYAGLQAAEKGVPFLPLRGFLGSDVVAHHPGMTAVANPFAPGDMLLAIAAIRPDIALIHAPLADRYGNVWIGRHRSLMMMAHAARYTLATVEAITDIDLLADEKYAPATIASLYVTAVAHAPRGAWPLGMAGLYDDDADHLRAYAARAATPAGFEDYLRAHVLRAPVPA